MLNPIRPGLRLVNQSNDVVRAEVIVHPGEEVELPDGALMGADRSPLKPVGAAKRRRKPAPADEPATEPDEAPADEAPVDEPAEGDAA